MNLALAAATIITNGFMLYLVVASFVDDLGQNTGQDVVTACALGFGFVASMLCAVLFALS